MNRILFFALLMAAGVARAETANHAPNAAAQSGAIDHGQVLRAGGDYVVSHIEQRDDGSFLIEFKSEAPAGRFDTLQLSSDHVHVGVKTGQKIRLSAEVASERGPVAEVSQVVIFLPNPIGAVPVWLLSNTSPPHDLRAVKYLEMHVPQTDFMVL